MNNEMITEKDLNCRDNGYIDYIEGEAWKVCRDFTNYIISSYGRVFSLYQKRLLKPYLCPYKDRMDYLYVKLTKCKGQKESIRLHKLVAETFIDNPKHKKIVHHIDCNALNNRADNLMWVTFAEHMELHKKRNRKKEYKYNGNKHTY